MSAETHSAEAFAERRKYARYSLRLRVNYSLPGESGTQATENKTLSRDLGIGGIALLVDEELQPGQSLQVKIDLPSLEDLFTGQDQHEALSAAERTVTLYSRVAWCRPYEEDRFIAGVQFLDLEQEDSKALKDFLEEYKIQDSRMDASRKSAPNTNS